MMGLSRDSESYLGLQSRVLAGVVSGARGRTADAIIITVHVKPPMKETL